MSGTTPNIPPNIPPSVGGGAPPRSRMQKIGIVLGVAVLVVFLFMMGGAFSPPQEQRVHTTTTSEVGVHRPPLLPVPAPDTALPDPAPPLRPAATLPPPTAPVRSARAAAPPKPSPIVVFDDREDGRSNPTPVALGGQQADAEDGMGARLRATRTPPAKARRVKNQHLTIAKGDVIPCVRETAVNTQLGGFVRCKVSSDVLSESGTTILLPRETMLVGEVKGDMRHGSNRAFILWSLARTPDGVRVDLDSPGTDMQGRNGIAVDVNTNFWARFGGAIMLSFIDSGLQAAAMLATNATDSGNGTRINFNQMQSGGGSAASRAVDATVNIPPFGTSPEGTPEMVFIARDLDFSDVYELKAAP